MSGDEVRGLSTRLFPGRPFPVGAFRPLTSRQCPSRGSFLTHQRPRTQVQPDTCASGSGAAPKPLPSPLSHAPAPAVFQKPPRMFRCFPGGRSGTQTGASGTWTGESGTRTADRGPRAPGNGTRSGGSGTQVVILCPRSVFHSPRFVFRCPRSVVRFPRRVLRPLSLPSQVPCPTDSHSHPPRLHISKGMADGGTS